MLKKNRKFLVLLLLLPWPLSAQQGALDIKTLFTTQKERQLINNNRYQVKTEKEVMPVLKTIGSESAEKKALTRFETISVKVSGITLSEDGKNIAWINGKTYENGDELTDGIKVYISSKVNNQVQMKTPDGKYHNLVTGVSSNIQYSVSIDG